MLNHTSGTMEGFSSLHPQTVCAFAPLLQEGLQHHGAGRLAEAAQYYQQMLFSGTPDPDALLLLGIVARQARQFPEAIRLTHAAIAQRPSAAHYLVNLGHAYRCAGDLSDAERWYRAASEMDPRDATAGCWLGELLLERGEHAAARECYEKALQAQPDLARVHHGMGNLLCREERYAEAAACYRRALELSPRVAEFHFGLGYALQSLGNAGESRIAFSRAIALHPNFSEAHLNMGNALYDEGDFPAAIASYRRALAIRPNYLKACINLGNALSKLRLLTEAIRWYRRALSLAPDSWIALHNLGNALAGRKELPEAEEAFRRALELNPGSAEIHNSLGNVLYSEGRMYEAASRYRQAVKLDASYARAQVNLGNALLALGDHQEARACYERGLALDPASAGAHYNLSLARLRAGEYAEGWKGYESRWDFEELHLRRRNFCRPMWKGESLEGRTILLHAEQGLGDTIQFARYASLIARRGCDVILEVQPVLETLLRRLPGVKEVVARGARLPAFDYHCPVMTLPGIFGTKVQTVPMPGGYLSMPAAETELALEKYPGDGLRVGLAWAGNPKHKSDRSRSMPLDALLPLARIPGLTLFSLQKGPATGQIIPLLDRLAICNAAAKFASFYPTAMLMSTLDLVISVDTSIAHLAGAMAKPVWIMLAHHADWRWMESRTDTPWYGRARIFRQSTGGDWDGVVERIAAELGPLALARNTAIVRSSGRLE